MSASHPKVLFLFPHPAKVEEPRILAGEMPRERLYGAMELQERGWQVDYADARFAGRAGRWREMAARVGVNFVDPGTLRSLSQYDCVVAKDSFSTMLTLAGKVSRTPVIYLDAMFALPKRRRRRWPTTFNLSRADRVLCYSKTQGALWADFFGVSLDRFDVLPYCIDLDFYRQRRQEKPVERMVLAVGRDLGRDFLTLARAVRGTDLQLTLVTLPYLLSDEIRQQPNIEILERIPYEQLFDLYARAACVAVPLHGGVTYPSGIRAVMESMSVAKSTIITESAVLREYFGETSGVAYVPAHDPEALRQEILKAVDDMERRVGMECAANSAMDAFGMSAFVDPLEVILQEVVGGVSR